MLAAVDVGYAYTKGYFGGEKCYKFSSSYMPGKAKMGGYEIEIDGQVYTVGVGSADFSPNRTDSDLVKLCVLSMLSTQAPDDYRLVTDLPIAQIDAQRKDFKEFLLQFRNKKVVFNGLSKVINIVDVHVYPQAIAAYYSDPELMKSDVIMIDLGSHITNIALIKKGASKVDRSHSVYTGVSNLYTLIADVLNDKYSMGVRPGDVENIFEDGLKIDEQPQDLSFLDDVIREYISPIRALLEENYPYKMTKNVLCGGGGKLVYGRTNIGLPVCGLLRDPQFANAKGLYNIGLIKGWR